MNINYKRIIREEINRLLSEAVDVSSLAKYMQPLKNCVSTLRNMGYSNNNEINAFLREICTYFLQVIYGLDRCVKANSLNEDFRLSDYGVQYPTELGGNLWNDFENGLYKGANWARSKLYQQGYINNGNGANTNGNANVDIDNPNSVPSVKLIESLRKLQEITFKWQDLKNRYQNEMAKYFNPIADGLTYISNINSDIVRSN